MPRIARITTATLAGAALTATIALTTTTGSSALTTNTQPPQQSDLGSVSGAVAAAQLRKGMPTTYTGTWAKTTLTKLTVRADGPMTGYDRALFPHWRDASTWGWPEAPSNSCDARNAALYRYGTNVTMSSTCTYLKGTWIDPYGAHRYDKTSDMDGDHMVPLANAWRSGAATWDTTQRTWFANEPLVLVIADDNLNSSKGDKGPEAWKPPNKAAWCNYATRWVGIKHKYALSVNTAEKTALTTMLNTCR